jgi:hypothetical protein
MIGHARAWTTTVGPRLLRAIVEDAVVSGRPTALGRPWTRSTAPIRTFITMKTVEARLGRAYRKIGVTGRAGLRDALADRTSTAAG